MKSDVEMLFDDLDEWIQKNFCRVNLTVNVTELDAFLEQKKSEYKEPNGDCA